MHVIKRVTLEKLITQSGKYMLQGLDFLTEK